MLILATIAIIAIATSFFIFSVPFRITRQVKEFEASLEQNPSFPALLSYLHTNLTDEKPMKELILSWNVEPSEELKERIIKESLNIFEIYRKEEKHCFFLEIEGGEDKIALGKKIEKMAEIPIPLPNKKIVHVRFAVGC